MSYTLGTSAAKTPDMTNAEYLAALETLSSPWYWGACEREARLDAAANGDREYLAEAEGYQYEVDSALYGLGVSAF